MLPKSQRLTKEKFDTVYSFGTNLTSDVGYFKILPWEGEGETQISCVAGRKSSKKATERNCIRRRGYAAIEQVKDLLPPTGYGIIWFLPPDAISMNFSDLKKAAENMIISLDNV